MKDLTFSYFIFNFISVFAVIYGAVERKVGLTSVFLISFFLTPIIGYLYVLCHSTHEDIDYHKKMVELMSKNNANEK